MTIPDPLDQKDLDLVAAFAAGMLDAVSSDRAREVIASDPRFADEHAAQLLAIEALGSNDGYQPLNDIEKARIRKAVVPRTVPKRQAWSIRVLRPLSIAAVAVVIVGFAGMTLFGGGADAEFASTDRVSDEAEQPVAAEAPAMDAATDAADDGSISIEEGALAPKFGIPIIPPEGELEASFAGDSASFEEFFDIRQWTESVPLSRYNNLECWPDAADYTEVLGVALGNVAGIDYEIVRTPDFLEARTVEGCQATLMEPTP